MNEKEIENYFVWVVETAGGKSFKFRSITQKGVSDRIACFPNGGTWFVELKKPKGGRLSPLQKIFADEMSVLQQNYACFWTQEQIDDWITKT